MDREWEMSVSGGTKSLNKTGIEYLDYSWNFYSGCRHTLDICPVSDKCWARTGAHRFGRSFEPTLHPEKLLDPLSLKKPSRIGVCFTGDLFGDWVDPEQNVIMNVTKSMPIANNFGLQAEANDKLRNWVFNALSRCPQHQFFFLTKNPKGYLKWGEFHDNAWLGATVTRCWDGNKSPAEALKVIENVGNADCKHRWISFEPLIDWSDAGQFNWGDSYGILKRNKIEWVVIGGWSGSKGRQPKLEWVEEIIKADKDVGIKVFLKNNLLPLMGAKMMKLKEVP